MTLKVGVTFLSPCSPMLRWNQETQLTEAVARPESRARRGQAHLASLRGRAPKALRAVPVPSQAPGGAPARGVGHRAPSGLGADGVVVSTPHSAEHGACSSASVSALLVPSLSFFFWVPRHPRLCHEGPGRAVLGSSSWARPAGGLHAACGGRSPCWVSGGRNPVERLLQVPVDGWGAGVRGTSRFTVPSSSLLPPLGPGWVWAT